MMVVTVFYSLILEVSYHLDALGLNPSTLWEETTEGYEYQEVGAC